MKTPILGTYKITYPTQSTVEQVKDLIDHEVFLNVIIPTKKAIVDLEVITNSENKEENTKKINELKGILKPFGSSFFTTKSPLGKAIETGVLDLEMPWFTPIECKVEKVC